MIKNLLEEINREQIYFKQEKEEIINKYNIETESKYLFKQLGFSESEIKRIDEGANDLIQSIISEIKKIKDTNFLNKIYSYLFKGKIQDQVKEILINKNIKNSHDISLITSWIIEENATKDEKMNFLKRISLNSKKPILDLSKEKIKEYVQSGVQDVIPGKLLKEDPILTKQFIQNCLSWVLRTSGAAAGAGEGFLILFSPQAKKADQGADVIVNGLKIEVKTNISNSKNQVQGGGALCGGKNNQNWRSINPTRLIEDKFNIKLNFKADQLRFTKTNFPNFFKISKLIQQQNFIQNENIVKDIIKLLVNNYFSKKASNAKKIFFKQLNEINFTDNINENWKNFKILWSVFNFSYYQEVERFDILFILNRTKQQCIFIDGPENFKNAVKNNTLKIVYHDFHWNNSPTSIRVAL